MSTSMEQLYQQVILDHAKFPHGRGLGAPAADAAPLFRQLHLARGGRLIRIASILPPVLSPNNVPRS